MHDIRFIRENPQAFDAAMQRRGLEAQSSSLLAIDEARRAKITAAEAATGQHDARHARLLGEPPPKKLPPAPVARVGANARLRWGEWRAGREF